MDQILANFQDTINELLKLSVKHSVHDFASGVIMLDIWCNGNFYVVQFEKDFIGLSQINDDFVGFGTVPQEKFFNLTDFKMKLHSILPPPGQGPRLPNEGKVR
jgi:hypothetical protein